LATARLSIAGPLRAPRAAGKVALLEGTVNGLPFRDAAARIELSRSGVVLDGGEATIGSTFLGFGAREMGGIRGAELDAPAAQLADFDDFFDAGDALDGHGALHVALSEGDGRLASDGHLKLVGLRYRAFALGAAQGSWSTAGERISGALSLAGPGGQLAARAALTADPKAASPLRGARLAGELSLAGIELADWLPPLGIELPLGGRLDGRVRIGGPLADPTLVTSASLSDGRLGSLPLAGASLQAISDRQSTRIERAELVLHSLDLHASGTVSHASDGPLFLRVHASSNDVGELGRDLLGSDGPFGGSGEADATIAGTRAHPHVDGGFDLNDGTLAGIALPRALGEFSLRGRSLVLSDAELDFAKGTLALAGSLPLVLGPFGFGPPNAPLGLDMDARGIELADFAPLLPKGTALGGRLDGHVALEGTLAAPHLLGTLALRDGSLRSPLESVPLTAIGAQLQFAAGSAALEGLHLSAGGGTLDGSGTLFYGSLAHPFENAVYALGLRAKALALDLPAYGSGQIDGELALSRRPAGRAELVGSLALHDATIPFAAFAAATGSGGTPLAPARLVPGGLGLDLTLSAGPNVRIRSANVDIGASGALAIRGTPAAPLLSGKFTATDGTLAYVNTVFRLLDGTVRFEPDLGLVPTLDAHAIAHVLNPDPNLVRNVTGSADVTLALHGPVNKLAIALSSDPPYDREQILGLLLSAPALGASNLFGQTSQQVTPFGSTGLAGTPPTLLAQRNPSGELSVGQEAFSVANAQFTRTLLAPLETSVAQAVGLSTLDLAVDYSGSVGVTARKVLGKRLSAIYGTSFGYPYRQTFGFALRPSEATAAQVTVFQTFGVQGLSSFAPLDYVGANPKFVGAQPSYGTIGFSLSLQHLYP
ncbi:MAG: translocation/assembly module TamB domain-containing protein, partial [Vulcanimicrobiaceae bacterium]